MHIVDIALDSVRGRIWILQTFEENTIARAITNSFVSVVDLRAAADSRNFTWTRVAGNDTGVEISDGPAALAALTNPTGLEVDAAGNLIIADTPHVRLLNVSGPGGPVLRTLYTAPLPASGTYDPMGRPSFNTSDGSVLLPLGNTIVSIAPSGNATVVAGTGTAGFSGDGRAAVAAQLSLPRAVHYRADTNSVYIADAGNAVVRVVSSNGSIGTVIGLGPAAAAHAGDGLPASAASIGPPDDVVFDAQTGVLYVSYHVTAGSPNPSPFGFVRAVLPNGTAVTAAGQLASTAALPYGDGVPVPGSLLRAGDALALGSFRGSALMLVLDGQAQALGADASRLRLLACRPVGADCGVGSVCSRWPDGPATPCPAGQVCSAGTFNIFGGIVGAAPAPCPPGSFCAGNGTAPVRCANGSYCPSNGQLGSTQEADCPERFYCPEPGTAVRCPRGHVCGLRTTAATPCPAGFTCHDVLPTLALGAVAEIAGVGVNPATGSVPLPCPATQYCPPGTGGNLSFLTGFPCPAGAWCPGSSAAADGSPTGGLSPPGFFSLQGSGSPTGLCGPGYFCPLGSGSLFGAGKCPPGATCPPGSPAPQVCPAGTFSETVGRFTAACDACPLHTYNPRENATSPQACRPCPLGTHTTSTGASSIDFCIAKTFTCPVGSQASTSAPRSEADCKPLVCAAGLALSADNATCIGCPPGTFGRPPACSACPSSAAWGAGDSMCLGLGSTALPSVPKLLRMLAALRDAGTVPPLTLATPATATGNGSRVLADGGDSAGVAGSLPPSVAGAEAAAALGDRGGRSLATSDPSTAGCAAIAANMAAVLPSASDSTASPPSVFAAAFDLSTAQVALGGTAGVVALLILSVALWAVCCGEGGLYFTPGRVLSTSPVGCKPGGVPAESAPTKVGTGSKRGGAAAGGPRATRRDRCRAFVRGVLVKGDAYSLLHTVRPGDPVRSHPTPLGGLFTLLGVLALSAVWCLMVLQRQAGNTLELVTIDGLTDAELSTAASTAPASSPAGATGLTLYLTTSGEPGVCSVPLSWSQAGMFTANNFTMTKLQCGAVSQLVFRCPKCVVATGSRVDVSLHYSCQVLLLHSQGTTHSGAVGLRNATAVPLMQATASYASDLAPPVASIANDSSAANTLSLLSSVSWSVAPMLALQDNLVTGVRTRGYRLLQGALGVWKTQVSAASFLPAQASVAVTFDLSPPAFYQSITITEKTTVLQLLASLGGVVGVLAIFGKAFSLTERQLESVQEARRVAGLRAGTLQPSFAVGAGGQPPQGRGPWGEDDAGHWPAHSPARYGRSGGGAAKHTFSHRGVGGNGEKHGPSGGSGDPGDGGDSALMLVSPLHQGRGKGGASTGHSSRTAGRDVSPLPLAAVVNPLGVATSHAPQNG